MTPKKIIKRLIFLGVITLITGYLIACQQAQTEEPPVEPSNEPPKEPPDAPPEEPTQIPAPTIPLTKPISTRTLPWCPSLPSDALATHDYAYEKGDNTFHIDGWVILTGPASEIEAVAGEIGLENIVASVGGNTQSRLYEYDQGQFPTVWDVIVEVQATALRLNVQVNADPDYVLNPITGNPWRVEGSPWRVEGSPAEGGVLHGPPNEVDFWGQWGFGVQQGTGILTGLLPDSRQGETGAGARVFIFDTSPFSNPGSYTFDFDHENPMELCVIHPESPSPLADPKNRNDHGLFVAGLVHAAAPGSQITLFRVLDDQVTGDLFTLITALSALTANTSLDDSVINLSLGLNPEDSDPPEIYQVLFHLEDEKLIDTYSLDDVVQEWRERIYADVGVPVEFEDDEIFLDYLRGSLPQLSPDGTIPVFGLDLQLSTAQDDGAVIVAAAGNDSDLQSVHPAQIPAAWDYVIGVGATNPSKSRSCFSNTGDVYAPGGDGDGIDCEPALKQCEDASCQFGVISLATVPPGDLAFGYGYWVGTSFAAPLVSGLAAQLHEAGEPSANILTSLKGKFQNNQPPNVTDITP